MPHNISMYQVNVKYINLLQKVQYIIQKFKNKLSTYTYVLFESDL